MYGTEGSDGVFWNLMGFNSWDPASVSSGVEDLFE